MKSNKILLVLVAVFFSVHSFCQNPGPLSAAGPESFSSVDGLREAADKTVNLFTGDVQFPIKLIDLSGRNELNVDVSLAYSSNVVREATTWNAEAPTSVVGLGWRLDFPKIVVDNRATGTREDDSYYLEDNGSMSRLFYIGTASGNKLYQARDNQYWRITYFPTPDKWEIVTEDGTKFTYGDVNSGRSTVQWIVHFNNWIGSSNVTSSTIQKQQASAWNLSEVVNLWGEKILFSYFNIDQKVGGSAGKDQTEASYLSTVTDVNGRTINFVYGNKNAGEYVEPHTENGTNVIDAYQERYETKFLDYIDVNNTDGSPLYKVDLDYSILGTGDTQKRLLTSIVQKNAFGQALPGYTFSYLTTYDATTNTGAMSRITSPLGGTIDFTYTKLTAARSKREFKVNAIAGYAEPKVWINQDYVLLTRRQGGTDNHTASASEVKLQVFNWDGEWLEWNLNNETLHGVQMVDDEGEQSDDVNTDMIYDYQNFRTTTQKDFFATLNKPWGSSTFTLNLYRKEDNSRTGWTKDVKTLTLWGGPRKQSLVSGDNFVAVCGNGSDIYVYTWDALNKNWIQNVITRTNFIHDPIVAGPNYIISNQRSDQDAGGDWYAGALTFYFLKEDRTWHQVHAAANSSLGNSYFHPSATFAVAMVNGEPEYFYNWDENFNITRSNLGAAISDQSFVNITNNATAVIAFPDGTGGMVARYNGQSWSIQSGLDYGGLSLEFRNLFSIGEDFVIRPKSGSPATLNLRKFNPNTNTWSSTDYSTANRHLLFAGNSYFIMVDPSDNTKANLYYRQPNGNFVKDPTNFTGLHPTPGTAPIDEGRYAWQGGFDFVVKQENYDPDGVCPVQSLRFKNGKINPSQPGFTESGSGVYADGCIVLNEISYHDPSRILAAGNMFVAMVNEYNQYDATEIKLYKVLDDGAVGALTDFAVRNIAINDGIKTTNTFLAYTTATATYNSSGTVCQYGTVKVYPGATSAGTAQNGYTEHHFFNGLTAAEISNPWPSVNYDQNSKIYMGLPYRTIVKNNSGAVVSESLSAYKILEKANSLARSSTVRLSSSKKIQELNEVNYFNYDINNGRVSSQEYFQTDASLNVVEYAATYNKFWYEVYDNTMSKNILTPIIQTKTSANSKIVECQATKWVNWGPNNVPAPVQTYVWKRTNDSDFTAWNSGQIPSTDWKLMTTVNSMNTTRGLVTEAVDEWGIVSSMVYSTTSPYYLVAKVLNAPLSLVFYEGFESATGNFSTESKLGLKSSKAAITVTPPSSAPYKLTYWKKVGSGDWSLIEQIISAPVIIGGSGILIDDIRLHSPKAQMITYSYDKFGNTTAISDPNNDIVYKEYDDFQRPKLTRDKDRKIVEQTVYSPKN